MLAGLGDWFYEVFVEQFDTWIAIGFCGQALFFSRFLVQWVVSERAKRSIIPLSFWFFSIGGSGLMFVYGLGTRDPVIITGQSLGIAVYLRNLFLIFRERRIAHGKPG